MKGLAILIGLSALIGSAAQAQLDPAQQVGSKIYTEPKSSADIAAIARFSKSVANCTHSRLGRKAVDRLLHASDPASTNLEEADLDWRRVERAIEACMGLRMEEYSGNVRLAGLSMGFTPNRLRALMMEEVYLADHAAPIAIPEDASELTNRTYVSTGDARRTAEGIGNYADCIVHRDPEGADGLLRTEPASPEEKRAAQALAPVLGACLIDGQTIEFTPSSIRALAADGLWARVAYGSKKTN